ncbi:MAG: rhomboid family intramembrane serine protease [Bacteroidetes bacterium]|nr:MAG: rhomboid family intramembrane serine protease [Bacteroidota bacterium]
MYQSPYQPPTQFSVFPPIIKNLLILNGLFYMAKMVAIYTNAIGLAQVLNWMALYAPGAPAVGYTIFGTMTTIPGFWPWQLVTYAFLHGDLGHIFFNMFALWMFGVQIEHAWGSRRFAIYYFTCVVGAGLLQMLVMWGQPVPTVGASGGVFGILLAFGMMFPDRYIMLLIPPVPIKAKWFVIGYGALELFFGVTGTQSGIAHFAHLGGMLFGFLLIQYWRGKLPIQPSRRLSF